MRGRTPSDGTRSQPSSTTPDAARSHSKLEVLVWIEPGWRRPPDNVPPLWRLDEILDTGGLLRRFLVLAHWPSPYVGSTHPWASSAPESREYRTRSLLHSSPRRHRVRPPVPGTLQWLVH